MFSGIDFTSEESPLLSQSSFPGTSCHLYVSVSRLVQEQAVDREHERDFFQQEIQKLEQQLKNPQKLQAGSEQRNQEVEEKTSVLCQRACRC